MPLERLSHTDIEFRTIVANGDVGRQSDPMFLRQDKARADADRGQVVIAEVTKTLGDFSKPGKARENPSIVE